MIFLPSRETFLSGGRLLLLILGILMAMPLPGQADDKITGFQAKVSELEQRASMLNVQYKTDAISAEELAEHRLVDAQVLYTLKDYNRAAIVLFDYVSKYKNARGYPEALFFLADSLYQKRDFLSAKRYFRMIVQEVIGTYYQEALQRLVELAMRTGDYSDVHVFLSALEKIPPGSMKPSVPYVLGKYYYFKKDYDRAIKTFQGLSQEHAYHFHGQYFIGTIYVQKKDYAAAIKTFQGILRLTPKTDGQKHVRALAYLGIGRLLYEKAKIDQAIDMYQKVSRHSPDFDTALYEIAWAYIKAKKNRQALRALELLALAQPNSLFLPRVRVLQGNLLIRLKDWSKATALFGKTREKFVPAYNRMKQIIQEHSDPDVFFDTLLAKNLDVGSLGTTIQIPKLALHWINEDAKVKRAINVVKDVRDIKSNVETSEKLIKRLEQTINSPTKIKIFEEFSTAKGRALVVENQLIKQQKVIFQAERDIAMSVVSAAQRSELEQIASEIEQLHTTIDKLPVSTEAFTRRKKIKLKQLKGLTARVRGLSVDIDSQQAQLVAAEKFFHDTMKIRKRKIQDIEAVKTSFRKETKTVRMMIVGLGAEVEDIFQAIDIAKEAVGIGGSQELLERKVKMQYRENLNRQHQVMSAVSSQLTGAQSQEFEVLGRLFTRCDKIQGVLTRFEKQIEDGVERKLVNIRVILSEEKKQYQNYATEIAAHHEETDKIAGDITYTGFQDVAKRFYEIVVRADIGIIDVAWALKDAKSREVSRLVRQQKMDLKLLDTEFKEVLEED